MRRYKIAFFIALTVAIVLGGAAGYLFYQTRNHSGPMPPMATSEKSSATAPPSPAAAPAPDPGEPKLAAKIIRHRTAVARSRLGPGTRPW